MNYKKYILIAAFLAIQLPLAAANKPFYKEQAFIAPAAGMVVISVIMASHEARQLLSQTMSEGGKVILDKIDALFGKQTKPVVKPQPVCEPKPVCYRKIPK